MGFEARIVEFAELLRQSGVRVSPGEVEDATIALREVGLEHRETSRAALFTTLVKRARDRDPFERLFALYFSPKQGFLRDLDRSLSRQIEEEGLLEGDDLEMLLHEIRTLGEGMSPFSRALLFGDAAALSARFRGASLQLDLSQVTSPLQMGFFSRRLLSELGIEKARSDLRGLAEAAKQRGLADEVVDFLSRELSAKLRAAEQAAREYVEAQAKLRRAQREARSPFDRPFGELSREELEVVQRAVRRLAERLKSRLVKKDRQRRKGALNVRRTLRKNMALGGVFAKIVFRRRRKERPEVVVLCDVSDSVRNVSRMMLLFVHTLQSQFSAVRSFAFVSDVGEITEAFREADANRALDTAIAGNAINLYGNSNYGRALSLFVGEHLPSIGRRTTVLIIGDARNNYNDPSVWALRELSRKAGRVIWITPEAEESWGIGDSEMLRYRDAVDRVVVVQSVSDLEGVADKILS